MFTVVYAVTVSVDAKEKKKERKRTRGVAHKNTVYIHLDFSIRVAAGEMK